MCWIFQVGSQVQQTAVAHKTYDAAFTEVFEFTGDGDPPANVSIIVMDWDKLSKDDYVGEATGFCVVLGRRMWAVARRQRRTWIGCGAGATGMDGCLYCVCVPACEQEHIIVHERTCLHRSADCCVHPTTLLQSLSLGPHPRVAVCLADACLPVFVCAVSMSEVQRNKDVNVIQLFDKSQKPVKGIAS